MLTQALFDIPSPGAYLARRRRARKLSIDDVAEQLDTSPHIPSRDRVSWLTRIEADLAPAGWQTIAALTSCYDFDPEVLAALTAIARGERDPATAPSLCRICASSVAATGLCSACSAAAEAA